MTLPSSRFAEVTAGGSSGPRCRGSRRGGRGRAHGWPHAPWLTFPAPTRQQWQRRRPCSDLEKSDGKLSNGEGGGSSVGQRKQCCGRAMPNFGPGKRVAPHSHHAEWEFDAFLDSFELYFISRLINVFANICFKDEQKKTCCLLKLGDEISRERLAEAQTVPELFLGAMPHTPPLRITHRGRFPGLRVYFSYEDCVISAEINIKGTPTR